MRRCPKCNRTYSNDAQKFCTKDGTSLVDSAPTGALGETVRLDSNELRTTQPDDEVTHIISRESAPPIEQFDPYKTIIARPPETRTGPPMNTADLMSSSIPPTPTTIISPTANTGPIAPPPAEPPRPEVPPAPSGPITPPSQPLPPPQSQPLPNVSGDLGQVTIASIPHMATPPPPVQMPVSAPLPAPAVAAPGMAATPPKKKSKLPLILGILFVLFLLGVGIAGAGYWFVLRPMLEARRAERIESEKPREAPPVVENTPTESGPKTTHTVKEVPAYSPPPDAVKFVNSKDKLDGKLAEHYVDFSFYYPQRWQKDPNAGVAGASNFAKVERRLPPDFTQENFAVGWYSSAGSEEGDRAVFPSLVANLSSQFAKSFAEYRKVSEGPSKAGPYDGYEFRFESISRDTDKGDIKIWGRVIFLPPVDGGKNGVTLLMLTTSLASELKSVNDVGVKGELPMMLESFRFGK